MKCLTPLMRLKRKEKLLRAVHRCLDTRQGRFRAPDWFVDLAML